MKSRIDCVIMGKVPPDKWNSRGGNEEEGLAASGVFRGGTSAGIRGEMMVMGTCPPSQTLDDGRERKGGENEDRVLGHRGYCDEVWLSVWVTGHQHLEGRFVGLFLSRRRKLVECFLCPLLALNYRPACENSVKNRGEIWGRTVDTPSYLVVAFVVKIDRGYISLPSLHPHHLPSQHLPTHQTPKRTQSYNNKGERGREGRGSYPHNQDNIYSAAPS